MPGGITLSQVSSGAIEIPASGKDTLFMDISTGAPAYKDASGNVHTLNGATGAAGPQGQAGPALFMMAEDGLQGDFGPPGAPGTPGVSNGVTRYIVAASDESVNNNTLQNDDELLFSVAANIVYEINGILWFTSGTSNAVDAKINWTVPASCTMSLFYQYYSSGATLATGVEAFSFYRAFPFDGIAGVITTATIPASAVKIQGIIIVAGTAGNIQLQWAQNVTTAGTPLVRKADSYFRIQQIT